MKCTVRGPRSRWVGPPVLSPTSGLSRSPSGRQRHYGAVELAGASEQVNVNDVVEVAENNQEESSRGHPVLAQVLSMWEDTFTGVFKFRARLLVQAADLPSDALARLRSTRHASGVDGRATGSKAPLTSDQNKAVEVFLTRRVKDLEVRSIVKPITLSVSASATTEISPGSKEKMGPLLTHAFSDASCEFHQLEGTDPILKRARVRQANAVALASRADLRNEAAKSGNPIVKSDGWLLPKRGAFARRSGLNAARGSAGGVQSVASSKPGVGSQLSSPMIVDDEEGPDDSETEEPPNPEDGEWKEGEDGKDDDATDTDSDSPRRSNPAPSVGEGFVPRTSARQRKSQRSPSLDAEVEGCSEVNPEENGCPVPSSPSLEAEVKEVSEEKPTERVCSRLSSPSLDAVVESFSEENPEAVVLPPPSTPTFQRRQRVPFKKRQVPLLPRPRRLAMPPIIEEPLVSHAGAPACHATVKSSVAAKVVRPVRTRLSLGLRSKPSPALPHSSSMEDTGTVFPQLSSSTKRKRSVATKSTKGDSKSDYPPLQTPVGKDYQADIPDLLSAEQRKLPQTGTGSNMVWRSVKDWDPQSRVMLGSYLQAAKRVVEAKQARPGVAVHVRLGGKKSSSGVGKEDVTGIASSYAVWAISSGREACGLVRVACSEVAQTDIPRSAIQRVQSQEQALSALVKARCVLDKVEPALQILADDQASPESIEPWTVKQVRTLEQALVKEYDPSRRLHGWARPGMEMDREDFIDLATVSKQVPGKTPAQVLSFYYRYLAAAAPLTDVVYGPEAAKARKQEPISPLSSTHSANLVVPGNGRLTPGYANTATPTIPASQVSPGLCEVNPANSSGVASESAPQPDPRVVRLSAPIPAEPVVANTKPSNGPAVDGVQKYDWSTETNPSPPANDPVWSALKANSHSTTASKHAPNEATSGDRDRPADVNCGTGRRLADSGSSGTGKAADRPGGKGGGRGSASEFFARQRRYAARGRQVSKTLSPVPRDAEVLEVHDSDDADGGHATRNYALSASVEASGGGAIARPSAIDVTARHINSVGPAALLWLARRMRRQAAPTVAPDARPRGVLPMAAHSVSRKSDRRGAQRTGGSDNVGYGYRREAPGVQSAEKLLRTEDPPLSYSTRHEEHVKSVDDRPSGGQVERGDISSNIFEGPRYGGQIISHIGPQPVSVDDTFGAMAPCWRLLERAQSYMDKDQLEYMRCLILTHVRHPMSRDQLLERAESCLQEQGQIFGAFVKMFDRIDQPPQVPLYPAKKALRHHLPQPASYNERRLPDADPIRADPIHGSSHGLPPPKVPTARTTKEHDGDAYSLRPINNGGNRGISMTTPSQPYAHVGMPVGGRVEVRRSIHPYDHNGAGGWRGSGVGRTGSNDAVDFKVEPPPRRLSPVSHPPNRSAHPPPYPQSRPSAGHGGEARVRNPWSKKLPGEWRTGAGFSAAATAGTEAPGSMIVRGSGGPAWGGGGGDAWS